jgi:hypothetical protein
MSDRTKWPYVDQTEKPKGLWKVTRTSPKPLKCSGRYGSRGEAEQIANGLSEAKEERWVPTRI